MAEEFDKSDKESQKSIGRTIIWMAQQIGLDIEDNDPEIMRLVAVLVESGLEMQETLGIIGDVFEGTTTVDKAIDLANNIKQKIDLKTDSKKNNKN
jgi:hypothetical protein